MTPDDVKAVVGDTGHMSLHNGTRIFNLIVENNFQRVLELGHSFGVSTCYIAAALTHTNGSIITVDRESVRNRMPNLKDFASALGLSNRIHAIYESVTYNWTLHNFLREPEAPSFDFIFLDGAHIWEPDALAFLLSWRFLEPNGLFLFDDLNWIMANSEWAKNQDWYNSYSQIEQHTPHVREIFELLAMTMPDACEAGEMGPWAYVRKSPD